MPITSLSLVNLGTACGTSANLVACAGGSGTDIAMTEFAVDIFSAPTTSNYTIYGDNTTYHAFTITGTSIGAKWLTRVMSYGSNVTWQWSHVSGPAITLTPGTWTSVGRNIKFNIADWMGLSTGYVQYKVVDAYNINATYYNSWISSALVTIIGPDF